MFEEQRVQELRPGLTPFPENVFVDDQPWLNNYLLPLMSIDLGILRPELAGVVVYMLRPAFYFDGYIGDSTAEFHNEFASSNWFAFRLTEDNRYRFLGKKEYFPEDDEEDETEAKEEYAKERAHFEEHGCLPNDPMYGDDEDSRPKDWLDLLGGDFWDGNWANAESPPEAFEFVYEDDGDHIELNYQGKPFFPVACADGLGTLLFYEPESRTALFTFDYT